MIVRAKLGSRDGKRESEYRLILEVEWTEFTSRLAVGWERKKRVCLGKNTMERSTFGKTVPFGVVDICMIPCCLVFSVGPWGLDLGPAAC